MTYSDLYIVVMSSILLLGSGRGGETGERGPGLL